MTEHGLSARTQGTEGCATDLALRSEFNVSNSKSCLSSNGNPSYLSRHASWDPERHIDEMILPGKLRRNLTGADITQIRGDVRRVRQLLLKCELSEAYELIDRVECALGDLPSGVARRARAETAVLRAMGAALQDDSPSALNIARIALRNDDISPGARSHSLGCLPLCALAVKRLRPLSLCPETSTDRPPIEAPRNGSRNQSLCRSGTRT